MGKAAGIILGGAVAAIGLLLAASCSTTGGVGGVERPGPLANRVIDVSKASYFVSPSGDDAKDGKTRATAFASIQKAVDLLRPGETALVTKGVYRKGFHLGKEGRPDAWINIVGEPGAEIRGSAVRKDWKAVAGLPGVYQLPRPHVIDWLEAPGFNEQVFVGSQLLRLITDKAMLKPKDVYYIDKEAKAIFVCLEGGKDPNTAETEVSTLNWAIAVGGPPNMNWWSDERIGQDNKAAYVRIDGFTIRNIADWSRNAAVEIRGLCHDIVVENCDIQWANYSGIAVSSMYWKSADGAKQIKQPAHHVTLRHNIISNCGGQGIGGGQASHLLFSYNILDGNNYKGISPWAEGGGIKTGFQGHHIVMRGNLLRNNDNEGLWIDNGSTDSVYENNFVYNSVAAGILNECTPLNTVVPTEFPFAADNPTAKLTAEYVKGLRKNGSVIRNNVIVGTRSPGGAGISVSSSNFSDSYNNVIAYCQGEGISFGGSGRGDAEGFRSNRAHANICYQNFVDASATTDAADPEGRFFDNLFKDNLFLQAKSTSPFKLDGQPATAAEFEAYNKGAANVVSDQEVFRNPSRWDFTLADRALADKVGFDPAALRLDWSEYFVEPSQKTAKKAARSYTPIDLSKLCNRGLEDEVDGDGKGGWTDQGPNDMSKLPLGRRTLDGVEYLLGPKENGAILLANSKVKPGGFPESVTIPVGAKFQELYFLYTSAYTGKGEVARFVIEFADGEKAEQPVVAGKHLFDWWDNLTWQENANLNDHNVFVAWQGANRGVGQVSVFYLKWVNPEPGKTIKAVTLTNRGSTDKSPFLLLGVSGANDPTPPKASGLEPGLVFKVSFDGDVDAQTPNGEIAATGYTPASFDAGKFTAGLDGKAFVPAKPLYYDSPAGFPLTQGTIAMWLKADEYTARLKGIDDYRLCMGPFQAEAEGYAYWKVGFVVKDKTHDAITLRVETPYKFSEHDATPFVKPGKWFHLALVWRPDESAATKIWRQLYIDGKPYGEPVVFAALSKPSLPPKIVLGVPRNGGQPWVGAMADLEIWNRALSGGEIAERFNTSSHPN